MLNQNNKLTNRSQQLFSVNLTYVDTYLVNELIKHTNIFAYVNPSQNTLAENIGCTRKAINRSVSKLRNKFFKDQYNHRRSSYYFLDPIFFNPLFREKYKSIFPQLAYRPNITLLLAEQVNKYYFKKTCLSEKVTPYKEGSSSYSISLEDSSQCKYTHLKKLSQRKEDCLQRKNKNKKKGKAVNLDNECKKILENLHLTADQLRRLWEFPEATIATALKKTNRRTNPSAKLLFFLCENMTDKEIRDYQIWEKLEEREKKQSPRSNTINEKNNFDSISVENNHRLKNGNPISSDNVYSVGVRPPTPFYSKSYDENLAIFSEWYENHFEAYCKRNKIKPEEVKEPIKQRFIDKLDSIFRDPSSIREMEKERRRIPQTIWTSSIYI